MNRSPAFSPWGRLAPALLALLLLPAQGSMGGLPEASHLFRQEAGVFAERPGLVRLDLPPEVLAACAAGLADLRVFGLDGAEIPYLVDAAGRLTVARTVRPGLRRLDRGRAGPPQLGPRYVERIELDGPERSDEDAWTMRFSVRAPAFLRTVSVRLRRQDGSVLSLVEDATLYRPVSGRHEIVAVDLPPFPEGTLVVTIEGSEPRWLEPEIVLESRRADSPGRVLEVPLSELGRRSEGGRTVLVLERPAGIVPGALRLLTSTSTFDRGVAAWDEGAGRQEERLGSGELYRVEDDVPLERIDLPVAPAGGQRLRVEIEDGDSPPLADMRWSAILTAPALVFSVPEARGPGTPSALLRFGGDHLRRPDYDIGGLLPAAGGAASGARADAGLRLYELSALSAATLGPVRSNPAFRDEAALSSMLRAGAEVDVARWSHLRALTVPEGREGLSTLRLQPADLAVLRQDLGDLRIVDAQGRQWPWLLVSAPTPRALDLAVTAPERMAGGGSSHELAIEGGGVATLGLLRLHPEAAFVDREFEVRVVQAEGPERVAARGRLRREIGDPRPIEVALPAVRTGALRLVVQDGDDAPLRLAGAEAGAEDVRVYLVAPQGDYTMLLGNPDEEPPTYELARARDVVLAVAAAEPTCGALLANPSHRARSRFAGEGGPERLALWVVLLGAVVLLGWTTLRAVRQQPAEGDASAPAQGTPASGGDAAFEGVGRGPGPEGGAAGGGGE